MILLIVFTGFVLLTSIANLELANFFANYLPKWKNGLFVLTGVFFLYLFFRFFYKKATNITPKQRTFFVVGCFAVLFVLQLMFIIAMESGLRYDALKVLDEAISMFSDHSISETALDGYFSRYSNNYAMVFFTYIILSICKALGFLANDMQNAQFILSFVNICFIDLAVFFGYRFIKGIRGEGHADIYLLFAVCNPLLYVWGPFYYTNTISMAFMMLLIAGLFYLRRADYKSLSKKQIWKYLVIALLLGFAFFIGVKVRATVLFTLLAFIIFIIVAPWRKKEKKGKIAIACVTICFAAGCMAGFALDSALVKQYVKFDYKNSSFPAVHWIMMGARGDGNYNMKDEMFTYSFPTKEEKVAADTEVLKERIEELGPDGYIELMFRKLKLTFSEASGGFSAEIGRSETYSRFHRWVTGDHNDLLVAYCQIYFVFIWFMLLFALFRHFKKARENEMLVIWINILGAFVFHMLWEAATVYSIGFTILFILAGTDGFYDLETMPNDIIKKSSRHKWVYLGGIFMLAAGVYFGLSCFQNFTADTYRQKQYVLNQFLFQCDETEELTEDMKYVQSFYVDKKFNRLSFQLKNPYGIENDASYWCGLQNESGEIVAGKDIFGRQYKDYDFVVLPFTEEFEVGKTYRLIIQKTNTADENLVFLTYDTGNIDAYRKGTLSVNDKVDAMRDLTFNVYYEYDQPYTGNVEYGLVIVLFIFAGCIFINKKEM